VVPEVGQAPPVLPSRELRLIIAGIQKWLSGLSSADNATQGVCGLLEGEAGFGQIEVLDAFCSACRELGIQVVRARASSLHPYPPGAFADLALGCVAMADRTGVQTPALDPQVYAEICRAASLPVRTALPFLGPQYGRSRLIDALASAFFWLSESAPLIVLIENLAEADSLTRDALSHLLRLLRIRSSSTVTPRMLLVAAVPTGYNLSCLCTDVTETEGVCSFAVRARGFTREELRDLAATTLGEAAPLSLREKLMQASGGNVRHLRWILWWIQENGGLSAAVDQNDLAGFASLVTKRYLQLSAPEKRIVAFAAALGAPVGPEMLISDAFEGSELEEQPPNALHRELLPALVERGWLLSSGSRTSGVLTVHARGHGGGDGEVFTIADPEVCRAVLSSLDEAERRVLFRKVAIMVKQLSTQVEAWLPQAFHLLLRAEEWISCVECSLAASAYLERIGCQESALSLLEDALEALPAGAHDINLTPLKVRRAELLSLTKNWHEAIEAYKELLPVFSSAEEQGRALRLIGDLWGQAGDPEAQVRSYGAGLSAVSACKDSVERLKLLAATARTHLHAKEVNGSLGYLDKCLEVIAEQGLMSDADYLEVYRLAQEVHFHRADYVEAIEFEQCLLVRSEAAGDVPGQLKSLRHLAHLHFLNQDTNAAATYLARGLEVARASGSRWLLAHALTALGLHERRRGDAEGALNSLHQAAHLLAELGDCDSRNRVQCIVAGLELEVGQFESCGRALQEFLCNWQPQPEDPPGGGCWRGIELEPARRRNWIHRAEKKCSRGGTFLNDTETLKLIEYLSLEGRIADARNVAQASLKRAWNDPLSSQAQVCFSLARLSALSGDYDGALGRLEGALQGGIGLSRVDLLSQAYLEASAIFLLRGDLTRGFDYLTKGCRCLFDDIRISGALRALECLAGFWIDTGHYSIAAIAAQNLAGLARENQLPTWELTGARLGARAQAGLSGGKIPKATVSSWGALVDALDLPLERARFKLECGWSAYHERDFEQAVRLAREGIELSRERAFSSLLDELLHLVGVVEGAAPNPRKNFLRALEALEQALSGSEARKRHRLRWEVLEDISEIYRARSKEDLAGAYLERAVEIEVVLAGTLPAAIRGLRWQPRRFVSGSARGEAHARAG